MPLTELPGFTEKVRRSTWTGETLPALWEGPVRCRCGGMLIRLPSFTADPLFFHGGYGEGQKVTSTVCSGCHRTAIVHRESVRPLIPIRLG